MAFKHNKEQNDRRMEMWRQGKTDTEIATTCEVTQDAIRNWRQYRRLKSNGKRGGVREGTKRTKSMQVKHRAIPKYDGPIACYLSDTQIQANISALLLSYGIDNSPVCRKANEIERRQFNIMV